MTCNGPGDPFRRVIELESAIAWLTIEVTAVNQARRWELIEQRERLLVALAKAEAEAIQRSRECGETQDPWRWAGRR